MIVVFNKADLIEDKQKDEIFSALLASGKTVEEVMTYLKSGNEEKAE